MNVRSYVHSVAKVFATGVGNAFHIHSADGPSASFDGHMGRIAEWYMTTDEERQMFPALRLWQHLGALIDQQYNALSERIHFIWTDVNPIDSADEITYAVDSGYLPVWHSVHTGGHPIWSDEQNNRFRAVHDVMGHYLHGVSFDKYGEEAAYRGHALTFPRAVLPALATETRGQNAALNYGDPIGTFKDQKCIISPDWVWAA